MSARVIVLSVLLFLLAGLMEIGGEYLVWLWLREGRSRILGALGGLVLVLYGVVPTLQPGHFARVYAAYGGAYSWCSRSYGAGGSTQLDPIGRRSSARCSASWAWP